MDTPTVKVRRVRIAVVVVKAHSLWMVFAGSFFRISFWRFIADAQTYLYTHTFTSLGVLLHIISDTLGSVGVIISALLIDQYGWMIADPICSIFIAVLTFISTLPLVRRSMDILVR